MIEVRRVSADAEGCAAALALLRREHAPHDDVDPRSTLELLPTTDDLSLAFRNADIGLVARTGSGHLAGYGLTWSWAEEDGTTVHLLDAWATPGPGRRVVLRELLGRLEAFVSDSVGATPHAVLGANSRSCESSRVTVLEDLGFHLAFAMGEMQLTRRSLATAARAAQCRPRTSRAR